MMDEKKPQDDGGLTGLVMQCAFAVIAGQKVVTISATGKRPAGFPRGELLSVGTNGAQNYAVCPIKVLAWVHAKTTKTANAEVRGASRLAGEASSAEGATSTVVLEGGETREE